MNKRDKGFGFMLRYGYCFIAVMWSIVIGQFNIPFSVSGLELIVFLHATHMLYATIKKKENYFYYIRYFDPYDKRKNMNAYRSTNRIIGILSCIGLYSLEALLVIYTKCFFGFRW